MGSLTVSERWAVFVLLMAVLVFAGWASWGKWGAQGRSVEKGIEVNWQESLGVDSWK